MASDDAKKQPLATSAEFPAPTQRKRPRLGWALTAGSQFLGILWLAPIVALLVLNFEDYVTGASVGCAGFCNEDLDIATLNRLQKRDRDILGALQFVAKVLEVWFFFIASSLVFDMALLLAVSSDGLPLRHLMTHVEYSDLRYLGSLFRRSFWTPAKPRDGGSARKPTNATLMLYGFLTVTCVLCVVVNLMGPTTAVLLLPTLGTHEISGPGNNSYFNEIRSNKPPVNLWPCQTSDLKAGRYSCSETDTFTDILVHPKEVNFQAGLWEQGPLWFRPNRSLDGISWPHNRQALQALTGDFFNYYIARSSPTYNAYLDNISKAWEQFPQGESVLENQYKMLRDSLQTVVRRKGPSIGSYSHCKRDLVRIRIAKDKEVHCYSIPTKMNDRNGEDYTPLEIRKGMVANRPSDDAGTVITKCARIGSGWGASTPLHAHFAFKDEGGTSSSGQYSADVYSVDQSIYLTPDYAHCAQDDAGSKCNWDRMFLDTPVELKNTSLNVQITEYTAKDEKSLVCETLAFLAFPNYQIEFPLYATTGFGIVLLTDITRDLADPPIRIHPDWMLAAVAVDRSATIDSGRKYSAFLAQALQNTPEDDVTGHPDIETLLTSTMDEALSLIDYSSVTTPSEPPSEKLHPLQEVSTEVRVWAYGFDSRTSKLGAVVALMGCVVVLVRTCVGLATRSITPSPMMLVATALKQREEVTLKELDDESEIGKRRFYFVEDEGWPKYYLPG